MISTEWITRPATLADFSELASLINFQQTIHRHLDWHYVLDWLGHKPFWVIEQRRAIVAALACPPEPACVAWVRLFFATSHVPAQMAWDLLLQQVKMELLEQQNIQIAAVSLQPWFSSLLENSNFSIRQQIVILSWEDTPIRQRPMPNHLMLRPIFPEDLPTLAEIDEQSFEPIWVNPLEAITLAYEQSAYATLAELDGRIVGFQLSTANPFNAHLARLAVLAECQGQGIGYALVQDMMLHFQEKRVWQITVNTQSTNQGSLNLYQKIGFHLTGEQFPVYICNAGKSTSEKE